ncbi:MAG: hypothetical protein Q7R60_01145 [bacterium]|nr:hypothetical protein [bacterium]
MSRILSRLIDRPEDEVKTIISRLEATHGYPSHDVRLLAEVNQAVKAKIASLGLDPQDTTAPELYRGLQAKFVADADKIDKAMAMKPDAGFGGRLTRAIELSKHVTGDAQVWTLKPTAAKNLLLSLPPKKLMKQLHYRSTASMLKHQDIGELYLLAPRVESSSWQSALARACSHLASNNYALSPINFVHPEVGHLKAIADLPKLNICNKLTGAVTIWPAKSVTYAPLITLTLMLLQSVRQLGVNIDKRALATVHPALAWWANTDHLVSPHPTGSISLNINDVAHNHLNSANHENSISHHGAKVLWAELSDRYQSLGSDIENTLEDQISKLIPAQLAAQLQEA